MNTDRWFWRCSQCLGVFAVNENLREINCECGGCCERMGKVERSRLIVTSAECPCDARCTDATGPKCECSCGGENHGSHRVIIVTRDAGPIPVARAANHAAAKEFADSIAAASDRIQRLPYYQEYVARTWIGKKDAWVNIRQSLIALAHAKRLKQHKLRLQRINAVAKEQKP